MHAPEYLSKVLQNPALWRGPSLGHTSRTVGPRRVRLALWYVGAQERPVAPTTRLGAQAGKALTLATRPEAVANFFLLSPPLAYAEEKALIWKCEGR